jgi:hypothetical protein
MPDGMLLGARAIQIGDVPPGVRLRKQNYEKWIRRATVTVYVTPQQASDWYTWLYKQEGKPYDEQAILGFIIGCPLHAKGHWICSAVITGAFRAIKKIINLAVGDSQVTPDSLFLLITTDSNGFDSSYTKFGANFKNDDII